MDTEICTERLVMRRARAEDYDAIHALVDDFDVVKMTGSWPFPPDPDLIARRSEPSDAALGMVGPVFLAGELIGIVGANSAAPEASAGELGYMFARAHWGRGYATEIGRALIAHVWQRYAWEMITACVFDDNPASGRVLEKLGFAQTGHCTAYCTARAAELPTLTYRLDRP